MSELRVNTIQSSGNIAISGITTFSETSSILISPGITTSATEGQTRFVSGDYATMMQVYNGTIWVTI